MKDPRLGQWELVSKPTATVTYYPSPNPPYAYASVDAHLIRPWSDKLFVYSLAETFLSLLTIRQLVAPVDIQGITPLDHILGLELVLLIAIFAFSETTASRPAIGKDLDP